MHAMLALLHSPARTKPVMQVDCPFCMFIRAEGTQGASEYVDSVAGRLYNSEFMQSSRAFRISKLAEASHVSCGKREKICKYFGSVSAFPVRTVVSLSGLPLHEPVARSAFVFAIFARPGGVQGSLQLVQPGLCPEACRRLFGTK